VHLKFKRIFYHIYDLEGFCRFRIIGSTTISANTTLLNLEYWFFDRIWIWIYSVSQISDIHIRISSMQRQTYEYPNIFEYSPFTKDNFWPNINANIFENSNFQYSYSNIQYLKKNIHISEYIQKFALHWLIQACINDLSKLFLYSQQNVKCPSSCKKKKRLFINIQSIPLLVSRISSRKTKEPAPTWETGTTTSSATEKSRYSSVAASSTVQSPWQGSGKDCSRRKDGNPSLWQSQQCQQKRLYCLGWWGQNKSPEAGDGDEPSEVTTVRSLISTSSFQRQGESPQPKQWRLYCLGCHGEK
jgi:hypothetical protein